MLFYLISDALILVAMGSHLPAQKAALGLLFIKCGVADGGFADPEPNDSSKDLKRRNGSLQIVENEADANLLMIVFERNAELRGKNFGGGTDSNKPVTVTISVREDDT